MAQDHEEKDTPAIAAAKGDGAWAGPALRILILGLNVWVLALWPALLGGGSWPAMLPPLALVAGLLLNGRKAPPARLPAWSGDALLLAVFPALVGLSIALRPAADNARAFGPLALSLLVLSTVAYLAMAASTASRRTVLVTADHTPLANGGHAPAAGVRERLRVALTAWILAGAFAVGVVAPTLGGIGALRAAWGETALEGGLLTAVVAAALAVTIAALFLGDSLRAIPAPRRTAEDRSLRVASLLLLTLLGAVTYFVIVSS